MKPTADLIVKLYEARVAEKLEQELKELLRVDLMRELRLIDWKVLNDDVRDVERFKLLTYEQNLKRRFNLI